MAQHNTHLPNTTATPIQQHSAPTNATDNTSSFTSSDPTTHQSTKASSKLVGDIKGAAAGVTGSLQAATGTVLRNDAMAEKGFEKMSQEDQRLAAKTGKPPVGTDTRSTAEPTTSGTGAGHHSHGTGHHLHGLGHGVPAEEVPVGEEMNTGELKYSGVGT